MKQFSQLGTVKKRSFVGEHIIIDNVLDKEIIVEFFDIRPSKKNDGSNCLYMQIILNGVHHVIFTGGTFLMDDIKQIKEGDFPFTTKIVKVNRHFEFS